MADHHLGPAGAPAAAPAGRGGRLRGRVASAEAGQVPTKGVFLPDPPSTPPPEPIVAVELGGRGERGRVVGPARVRGRGVTGARVLMGVAMSAVVVLESC